MFFNVWMFVNKPVDSFWQWNTSRILQSAIEVCWVTEVNVIKWEPDRVLWHQGNDVYVAMHHCPAIFVTYHLTLLYQLQMGQIKPLFYFWHYSAAYYHQSAVETSGGAGAGKEPHQVRRKGKKAERWWSEYDPLPTPHQSNRILSAQTRTVWHSVCGNASAPLVGFHSAL